VVDPVDRVQFFFAVLVVVGGIGFVTMVGSLWLYAGTLDAGPVLSSSTD
jgi:hypothetical protein